MLLKPEKVALLEDVFQAYVTEHLTSDVLQILGQSDEDAEHHLSSTGCCCELRWHCWVTEERRSNTRGTPASEVRDQENVKPGPHCSLVSMKLLLPCPALHHYFVHWLSERVAMWSQSENKCACNLLQRR